MGILISITNYNETFNLNKNINNIIGRSSSSNIIIDRSRISKKHAEIFYSGSAYFIKDLLSTYGTKLNNIIINNTPRAIYNNDIITLGNNEFIFKYKEECNIYSTLTKKQIESRVIKLDKNIYHLNDILLDIEHFLNLITNFENHPVEISKNNYKKINSKFLCNEFIDILKKNYNIIKTVILTLDEDTDILYPISSFSYKPNSKSSKISYSISLRAFNDKKTIIISDAQQNSDFKDKLSVIKYNIKSVICVPMIFQGFSVGVIYIESNQNLQTFNSIDTKIIEIFSNILAQWIGTMRNRKKIFQKQKQKKQEKIEIDDFENKQDNISDIINTFNDKKIKLNPAIEIEISSDNLNAIATIDKTKLKDNISFNDIVTELDSKNINEGIINENINELLKNPKINKIEIAKANIDNPDLNFYLDNNVDIIKLLKNSNNEIIKFNYIDKNFSILKSSNNKNIKTISGELISSDIFIDKLAGINIFIKNFNLFSSIYGEPIIYKNKIHIIPIKKIEDDINNEHTTIEFKGNVLIMKNILKCFKISADHNIIIRNNISNSNLYSKFGNITINGNASNGRIVLNSAIDLNANSFNNVIAVCKNNCFIKENIKDSFITSYFKIIVSKNLENGTISGGNILCGNSIECNEIGNAKNHPVNISINTLKILQKIEMDKHEKFEYLTIKQKAKEKYSPIIEKINKAKKNLLKLPLEKQKLLKKQLNKFKKIIFTIDIMEYYNKFLDDLCLKIKNNSPYIKVKGKIYPNVTIEIEGITITTNKIYENVIITLEKGKIKIENNISSSG